MKKMIAVSTAGLFITLGAHSAIPVHELIKDATSLDVGTLTVGGAIRASYIYGDYPDASGPGRGNNGGNMEFDTFRINVDWEKEDWSAAVEYRWYDGYNFFHSAWIGYDPSEVSQIQVGLNRVPFGVGDYGPANSWFFDQHYYVGLADDMDLGVKYTRTMENVTLDLAYYVAAEPNGQGSTADSARYSFDIVDTGELNAHYRERNQVNARVLVSLFEESALPTEAGVSLQVGQLIGDAGADDTIGYAASVHSSSSHGPWNLKLQFTGYDYRPEYNDSDQSDDLIMMGAYDWAVPVASKGLIPAAALSYTWMIDRYEWIDSITFYNDFSVILKDGHDNDGNSLNHSALNVSGMAVACGNWYTYIDYATSNGNYFVGPNGDFGANADDGWEGRFNINLGYYF